MKLKLPSSRIPSRVVLVATLMTFSWGFGVSLTTTADQSSPPLDLTGVIWDCMGEPVENARVFIYTAGPRVGSSPI